MMGIRTGQKPVDHAPSAKTVLDALFVFAGICTPDGILIEANQTALEAASLRPEDVVGQPLQETYWWAHSRVVQARLQDAILGASAGEASRYNEQVRMGEDHYVTIDFQIVPIIDERGEVTHLLPSAIDITGREQTEKALLANEARYRAILETTTDAVISINRQGIIESVNPAFEQLFGYEAEEIIGRHISRLMPAPFHQEYDRYIRRYLRRGGKRVIGVSQELMALRKDGSVFPIEMALSRIRIENGILFTGFLRDISVRRDLEQRILSIIEEERLRVGRDLHDDIASQFTGIAMLSQAGARSLTQGNPVHPEMLEELARLAGEGSERVRALARGLCPVKLDERGLGAALEHLARDAGMTSGITCRCETDEDLPALEAGLRLQLYRIAQEAVRNAVAHAEARHIRIRLGRVHDQILLTVEDDGTGMKTPPEESTGMGLRIMKYRAGVIGASLQVNAAPGRGLVLRCAVPVSAGQLPGGGP